VELFRGAAASKNKADGEAHLYAEQEALSSSLRSAGSVIGQADEVLPMHDIYICICIFAHRNINIYINIKKQKKKHVLPLVFFCCLCIISSIFHHNM
jgi:hypothetical protein